MRSSLRIIVTGLMAQHYTLGGVAWDYLQYLAGLKNLGHDVWYFEDSGEWPYSLDGGSTGNDWVAKDCKNNINNLEKILAFTGLESKWAYRFPTKSTWYGLSDAKRKDILDSADLLINISGTLEHPSHYENISERIYIDSDPGFTQVKIKTHQKEFTRRISEHTIHFSFGETLPDALKTDDIYWHPTRTPIVLSYWNPDVPGTHKYTTVMNWTSYPPLEYDGKKYGQKDVEFGKFLRLPQISNNEFELALSKTQHKNWQTHLTSELNGTTFRSPKEMLLHFGWNVVDAQQNCHDMFSYRKYIENSRAEWSVAKSGYVVSRPGWFSCRSACYLAAAKPVVVQDTGFGSIIPTGKGVHTFTTTGEIMNAIERIESDFSGERKAAREIADEFFKAEKVLSKMIDITYANSKKFYPS